MASNPDSAVTRAGALIGTPNYMSPEQISGVDLDARSDLWGLAAIVYRMAVGRAPFGSGSLSELAMRIVSTEPPTPTALAPDLPHEFDLWVAKGLAKKAEARFQNARELADSLAMVSGVSATGTTGSFSSAAAERLALAQQIRPGGAVNRAIDAAAAQQRAVRRVDDRIDVERGDVRHARLDPAVSDGEHVVLLLRRAISRSERPKCRTPGPYSAFASRLSSALTASRGVTPSNSTEQTACVIGISMP